MSGTQWYRVADEPRVRVASVGLACCALEVESAVRLGLLVAEDAGEVPPADRTTVLVPGTMTGPLGPAVAAAVERLAAEADGALTVIAVGACASTGGPYWDAPSVVNGIDFIVPVSVYVPGCPPRPEALVDAVLGRTVAA